MAPPSERDGAARWALVARWTTELLVVFVGVYGAFALSEWEESREREERASQIRAALASEIRGIQGNTRGVALAFPAQIAAMDSAMRAGDTPPLEPLLEPVRVESHVWEATLQGGGLIYFDVDTFVTISEFYNLLNAGFEQLEQLRLLSERSLLPQAGADAATFYTPAPGGGMRLRPEYRWYTMGLSRLGWLARCITAYGDTVLTRIGEATERTVAPVEAGDCGFRSEPG